MQNLLKKHGAAPGHWITDKLLSYGAALRQLGANIRHVTVGRLTNRAENSHLPVRQRDRRMQRHLISRRTKRQFRGEAIGAWHLATSATWPSTSTPPLRYVRTL
jgi:putative transposase